MQEMPNEERWFAIRMYFITSHQGFASVYERNNGNDYRLIFDDNFAI